MIFCEGIFLYLPITLCVCCLFPPHPLLSLLTNYPHPSTLPSHPYILSPTPTLASPNSPFLTRPDSIWILPFFHLLHSSPLLHLLSPSRTLCLHRGFNLISRVPEFSRLSHSVSFFPFPGRLLPTATLFLFVLIPRPLHSNWTSLIFFPLFFFFSPSFPTPSLLLPSCCVG
ncbi:uncharacterized protein BO72DRAFT_233553 [Aspergillus fijiensis CBS 313.89]|uniref:Uncharacterized protein n=1 Tax=Aspergillus fijiensis CBS 313.89 TaxID=1448319 RepID=A0A8G1RJK9_9EURO|nr:uncharacterized protein BO72DRAFT_233553 [Aspergillus fijiensis CBS 313.89]RAK73617.1 hypothetical protein BO72DRAFT_233553 [Aspergillus fijiensis CBS 313.89]